MNNILRSVLDPFLSFFLNKTMQNNNNCHHCNSDEIILALRQELALKNHQLERLELDLKMMNQKYIAEIERVGNVQHEKDLVELELEELSRKLFEEANAMVAIEKKARHHIENELLQTKEQLIAEQTQLHELRSRFNQADTLTEATMKNRNKQQIHLEDNTLLYPTPSNSNHSLQQPCNLIDYVLLKSFQEYVTAASKKLLSPKKLNQTPFMKYCLSEDIEPCLRFGPQSKLSVKKMLDYLSRQPCFIETHHSTLQQQKQPYTKPLLWERFSQQQHHHYLQNQSIILSNSCSACGRSSKSLDNNSSILKYRFKLDENDNWLPIDQYCRDRLVAVCEFFVFIRNIQLGLYSDRSIEDLYKENIRLKLQMFYSR